MSEGETTDPGRFLRTRAVLRHLNVSRSTLYRDAQLMGCASRVGRGRGTLRFDRNAVDLVMALRSKQGRAA